VTNQERRAPTEVLEDYTAAMNAGDADRLMALISPEIVDESWACTAQYGRDCVGLAEYGALVAQAMENHFTISLTKMTTTGTKVDVEAETTFDVLAGMPGIERLRQLYRFDVVDGLIVREVVGFDESDEQTAAFLVALASTAEDG
jgi:SnoaL-like domain